MAAKATYVRNTSGFIIRLGMMTLANEIRDRGDALKTARNLAKVVPGTVVRVLHNGRLLDLTTGKRAKRGPTVKSIKREALKNTEVAHG
jgi:hypothetical protein